MGCGESKVGEVGGIQEGFCLMLWVFHIYLRFCQGHSMKFRHVPSIS